MAPKKKKEAVEKTAFEQLSDRHKLFVKEYVKNFSNGRKAYQACYPGVKNSTAEVNASKLLSNAKIKKAVEDEYARIWKEKDSEIEKSKTYAMIHCLGNSDISDIVDMAGGTLIVKNLDEIPAEARQCIQSIEYTKKETQHGIDENIKVRLHPKLPALETRAKIQKLIDPKADMQQIEITVVPARRPGKDNKEDADD